MKQVLRNNLIVVLLYILAGIIFDGYHPYMLCTFLILSAIISFFMFRTKSKEETHKGLLLMFAPFLFVLAVAPLLLSDSSVRTTLPYLLFVPAVVYLVYCVLFSTRKVLFFVGIIALSVIGTLTYNEISGTNVIFESHSLRLLITQE